MLFVSWSVDPPEGVFSAATSWGPGHVNLLTDSEGDVVSVALSDGPMTPPIPPGAPAAQAMAQVRDYLAGQRSGFDLTCRLQERGPFYRAVVEALVAVAYGEVVTYGHLARRIGRPGAARAVGRVMASNPCPLLVPCHRVVSSGGLGGYGPGLAWKRALLYLEGWNLGEESGAVMTFRAWEKRKR